MLRPSRSIGLLVGFVGVAIVVAGPGLFGGQESLLAAGEVLLVAILYAIAPFIVARKLNDVPSLGTIVLSLLMIGVIYLPIGILTQHEAPTLPSLGASRPATTRASVVLPEPDSPMTPMACPRLSWRSMSSRILTAGLPSRPRAP